MGVDFDQRLAAAPSEDVEADGSKAAAAEPDRVGLDVR
jgi:hypothetical protein